MITELPGPVPAGRCGWRGAAPARLAAVVAAAVLAVLLVATTGDGTTRDRRTPVRITLPKGITVTAVSAGKDHSLALTSSGHVLAWGANNDGQLGDNTTADRHTPVRVHTGQLTVVGIGAGPAASASFSIALGMPE